MDTIIQSEDPPGPSGSTPWINLLAGIITSATLAIPLYVTLEFSSVDPPQATPTQTARRYQ